MSRRLIAGVLAALALTLTAATAEARTDSSPDGRAAVSGPFLGSYSARLTTAQAISRGDARLAGRFVLVLRANGTYTASNEFDGRTDGKLAELPNHRLRFSKDTGCMSAGAERPAGGVYRWSLNGRKLLLRLVTEGACTGRTETLTYPIWVRR